MERTPKGAVQKESVYLNMSSNSQVTLRERNAVGQNISSVKCANWSVLTFLDERAENDDPIYPFTHTAELLQQVRVFQQSQEMYWLPGVINALTHKLLVLDEKTPGDLCVYLKNGPKGGGDIVIEKKGKCVFASSHLRRHRRRLFPTREIMQTYVGEQYRFQAPSKYPF